MGSAIDRSCAMGSPPWAAKGCCASQCRRFGRCGASVTRLHAGGCRSAERLAARPCETPPRRVEDGHMTDVLSLRGVRSWREQPRNGEDPMSDIDVLNRTLVTENLGIAAYEAALGSGL